MRSVFIDGQHGTTGIELAHLLRAHPGVDVLELAHEHRRDQSRRQERMGAADLVVLCLPSSQVDDAIALAPEGSRVLDTSNRFRTSESWVYGLAELGEGQRAQIAGAARVSNPGCFATAFILLTRPLVDAQVVGASATLHAFGFNGYSAGGRRMIAAQEGGEQKGGFYGLNLDHRHIPEMTKYSGLEHAPVFVPAVGGHRRGLHLALSVPTQSPRNEILALYRDVYADCPLVRVRDESPKHIDPSANLGMHIDLRVHGTPGRTLLSAALDNLLKGAAVNACQVINLMLGRPTHEGLL